MKDKTIKIDLSKIANTALQEKVDKELEKVLENILDLNTEAKTTRKVTITLTMSTDDERTVVNTGILEAVESIANYLKNELASNEKITILA